MAELRCLTIQGRGQLSLNHSLLDILSLPSLCCVALDGLSDVPASFITTALKTCREVSLSRLTIAYDAKSKEESPPSNFLWHLDIFDPAYQIIGLLLHPKQLHHLQRLSRISITIAPIPPPMLGSFTDALAACASTLEHIELEFTDSFALPLLPALSDLELWIHSDTVLMPATLPAALSLALTATPHLEILTVSVRERTEGLVFEWDILAETDPPEWPTLDHQLLKMAEPSEPGEGLRADQGDEPAADDRDSESALEEVHFCLRAYWPDRTRSCPMWRESCRALEAKLLVFSYHGTVRDPMGRFSKNYNYLGTCLKRIGALPCPSGQEMRGAKKRNGVRDSV
ncbi:hypothetical protein K438DRAFT_2066060 [Mycena galopus ATCC 62051]|nr:hypothetical protein K438DRAFT_2066060 [Mycena galopus ATCC 62051]